MLKPSFLNTLLFWFTKYIVFYVFMMIKNNNYALIRISELKTGEDWFYYLWMFLFLPLVAMLIFSVPLYLSFKAKSSVYFTVAVIAVFVAEFFIYTWLASQANLMNGIYNGIISVVFLMLFFYRYIKKFYQEGELQKQ